MKPSQLPLPQIRWRHSAKPDWANDRRRGRVPPLHCLCAQTSLFLEPWEAAALFPGVLHHFFLDIWTEIPKRTGVSAHGTMIGYDNAHEFVPVAFPFSLAPCVICLCLYCWVSVGREWPHREGTRWQSSRGQTGDCRESGGSNQLEDAYLCTPTNR